MRAAPVGDWSGLEIPAERPHHFIAGCAPSLVPAPARSAVLKPPSPSTPRCGTRDLGDSGRRESASSAKMRGAVCVPPLVAPAGGQSAPVQLTDRAEGGRPTSSSEAAHGLGRIFSQRIVRGDVDALPKAAILCKPS